MRKVLVVVDMQNDFIDGALGTSEAQAMLPRMAAKLTAEQAASTVIVFTMAPPPRCGLSPDAGGEKASRRALHPRHGRAADCRCSPAVCARGADRRKACLRCDRSARTSCEL